jgi:hypothetical protein
MKEKSKRKKSVTQVDFKDALIKKALGYDATEVVEEYVSGEEGEIKLTKKKERSARYDCSKNAYRRV